MQWVESSVVETAISLIQSFLNRKASYKIFRTGSRGSNPGFFEFELFELL
jgi:hypothetical protein